MSGRGAKREREEERKREREVPVSTRYLVKILATLLIYLLKFVYFKRQRQRA